MGDEVGEGVDVGELGPGWREGGPGWAEGFGEVEGGWEGEGARG